ncbi:sigma-54 dependent transcriptional regulator [uncultured Shewanella sp.]|uniref:sigma 54-interacting transcriptional regulator n=1 Tax=uncultured Shewanella sp. TaxID=173975 RepID=UPI002617D6D5|nr:sigma-54 dependent transcriptional regulator [uncultured Shewanella sp.]
MTQGRLLLVEDDDDLREALTDTLLLANYECHSVNSAEAAIVFLKQQVHPIDLVVSDVQMQGIGGMGLLAYMQTQLTTTPLLLMTAFASIDAAIAAIKQGAVDYLQKPFSSQVLLTQVSRYLQAHSNTHSSNTHTSKSRHGKTRLPRQTITDVIAADEKSLVLLDLAKKVALSTASVMILGPSGTGKEVLARYIHESSDRVLKPFVAINCAAIPEAMLEATLFGYEKGAFTGAHQACPGKFELAQGGSILLDEISEMPLALQAKLLRVLQERELERLGGRKIIKLDVRVLATSNRDLQQWVSDGLFREDLYYRIHVFPLTWPALAERPKDILPLSEYLLQRHQSSPPYSVLSEPAKYRLQSYAWPGNVRELDNVLQRALIVAESGVIEPQDLLLNDGWQLTQECSHVHVIDQVSVHDSAQVKVGSVSDMSLSKHDMDMTPFMQPVNQVVKKPMDHYRSASTQKEKTESKEPKEKKGPLAQLSDEKQHQEYHLILQVLQHYQGQRKAVADQLGISPRTLRYKMAKMRELGMAIPSA